MATNSMIPYSNPAGNNQTTPPVGGAGATSTAVQALPGVAPTVATAAGGADASSNPLIPATSPGGAIPSVGGGSSASEVNNIFGSGVGGDINSFLGSIGGTNSVVLQEYINSLHPQMAKAQADTNAALGAGGVSANSSVAAIADSNLQSQESASIASESAHLTETGMGMQESMIQSMIQPAEQYKQSQDMMPWEIAGAAIGAGGKIASAAII